MKPKRASDLRYTPGQWAVILNDAQLAPVAPPPYGPPTVSQVVANILDGHKCPLCKKEWNDCRCLVPTHEDLQTEINL